MKPLSAISMLLRRMEVDVTVHRFRSSARSWMADNTVPFELGESCLAHAVGDAVVHAYQRSSMLERRHPIMSALAPTSAAPTPTTWVAAAPVGKPVMAADPGLPRRQPEPWLRAISVRQPWAWAIIHAGKDCENRNMAAAKSFRPAVGKRG